jgi:type IV pilus secretin PilQ/predicted competence protein
MAILKKLYVILLFSVIFACSSAEQQSDLNEEDELEVSDQEEGLENQQSSNNSNSKATNLNSQGESNSTGNALNSAFSVNNSVQVDNVAKDGLNNLSSDITGNSAGGNIAAGNSAAGSSNSTLQPTGQVAQNSTTSSPGIGAGLTNGTLGTATDISTPGSATSANTQVQIPAGPRLTWVGFDYRIKEGQVRVEIVTEGNPKYGILGEVNQKNQPEMVIRLYQTSLKRKIRRDLDCSEFKSPVAYIRMREDLTQVYSDVVITLRDKVNPKLFAEKGNILLTFSIPDKYYGNSSLSMGAESKGKFLSGFSLAPLIQPGSELPVRPPSIPDPTKGAFKNVPEDGGSTVVPQEQVQAPVVTEEVVSTPASAEGSEAPEAAAEAPVQSANPPNANGGNIGLGNNDFNSIGNNLNNNGNKSAELENNESNQQQNENQQQNSNQQLDENEQLEELDEEEEENDTSANDNFNVYQAPTIQLISYYQVSSVGADGFALDEDLDAVSPGGASAAYNSANSAPVNSQVTNSATAMPTQSAPVMNAQPATNSQGGTNTSGGGGGSIFTPPSNASNVNTATVDSEYVDLTGADATGQDSVAGAEASGGNGQVIRPVKLDFTGAKLSDVLRVLSIENGTNFIFSDSSVKDILVDVHLTDVSWTDALGAILETYGLGYVQLPGNVVRIDKFANLKGQKVDVMAAKIEALKLQRTRQMMFKLSYAKAESIKTSIAGLIDIGLDPRMKSTFDQRTNTVIIEAVPEMLSKFKTIIERLDTPTPQVRIAARIVEVQDTFSNSFGVKWGTNLFIDAARGLGFGTVGLNSSASNIAVDLPQTTAMGTINSRIGSVSNTVNLDAALTFAESKNTAKILQNTSVLVLDQQKATIKAGSIDFFEITSSSSTGTGSNTSLSSVEYTLSLDVTPSVTADGSVQLGITLAADTPKASDSKTAAAAKLVKNLTTSMIKRSGETAVIGGVYTTKKEDVLRAVPFFSKIPIIGWLFKNRLTVLNKSELIIFVTPVIVTNEKMAGTGGGASFVDTSEPSNSLAVDGAEAGSYQGSSNSNVTGGNAASGNIAKFEPTDNQENSSNNSQGNQQGNQQGSQESNSQNGSNQNAENSQNSGNNSESNSGEGSL